MMTQEREWDVRSSRSVFWGIYRACCVHVSYTILDMAGHEFRLVSHWFTCGCCCTLKTCGGRLECEREGNVDLGLNCVCSCGVCCCRIRACVDLSCVSCRIRIAATAPVM